MSKFANLLLLVVIFIAIPSMWILVNAILNGLFILITGESFYDEIISAVIYSIATFVTFLFLNWFYSNRKKIIV